MFIISLKTGVFYSKSFSKHLSFRIKEIRRIPIVEGPVEAEVTEEK